MASADYNSESSDELRTSEGDTWVNAVQESISRLQHEYEETYTQTNTMIGQIETDQNQMRIKLGDALTKLGIIEESSIITESRTTQIARELKNITAKVKVHDEQFEGKLVQLRDTINDHGERIRTAQQNSDQKVLTLEMKMIALEKEQEDTKDKVQVLTDIISTKLDHAKIQNVTNERVEQEIDTVRQDINTMKNEIRDMANSTIITRQNIADGLRRVDALENGTVTGKRQKIHLNMRPTY